MTDKGAVGKKLSVRKLTTVFAGGNSIAMVLRMVGGFLSARACDPAILGLFNGMGLVLGYAPILQFGVLNGLNRELPYYIGAGEHDRAHELAATAQAWALMVGGFVAAALVVFGTWQLVNGRFDLAAGWFTYAFTAFLSFYAQQYLQITYRTGGDFARLAVINVVQNALSLLLVTLVWLFSFYGFCLRALLVGLVNLLMLWKWRPLQIKPFWKQDNFIHLLKIGAPIFLAGQLYAWWIVIDSTLVLKFTSTKGLGLYQLGSMAGQALELLPIALAQICYPRMAEEYGRTGSLDAVLKVIRRPIAMMSLCMIPLVILGWFVLPSVVQLILPKYMDGVPAAQWKLCAAALLSLSPVCDVFSVNKRLGLYLTAVVVGIVVYAVILYLLTQSTVTLEVFPQAMFGGRLAYILFSFVMIACMKSGEGDKLT